MSNIKNCLPQEINTLKQEIDILIKNEYNTSNSLKAQADYNENMFKKVNETH